MKTQQIVLALAFLSCVTLAPANVVLTNMPGNDLSLTQGISLSRQKALAFQVNAESSYILNSALLRFNVQDTSISPLLSLHEDSGSNSPGAPVGVFTSPGGYTLGNGNYQFLGSFVVLPSTKYWLKLSATVEPAQFDWLANSPAIAPTGAWSHQGQLFSQTGSSTWAASGIINSYELKAAPVPEPVTMMGLAAGLAALGLRRKRA